MNHLSFLVTNHYTKILRVFLSRQVIGHGVFSRSGSDIYIISNLNYSSSTTTQSQFGRKKQMFELNSNLQNKARSTRILNDESEVDIDVITKLNDPDIFGNLSVEQTNDESSIAISRREISKIQSELSIFTEPEADDYIFIPENRWSDQRLKLKIKSLLRDKKLTEALDIFTGALKDTSYYYDKYALGYMYALLIIECGNVGHVEMAFRLYRDYVKRGLTVKPQIFTYLLNACANSPWNSESNLKRIDKLRENMKKKGFLPNEIHYHAMIKAYGRNGDIQSAFSIVDEMIDPENINRIRPNNDTFAFLLQSCISETKNGFKYALVTWRKMIQMKIRPNIYCFNLFLRSIRECNIEIPKSTISYLRSNLNYTKTLDPIKKVTNPVTLLIEENHVVSDLISLNDEHPIPENKVLKEILINNDDIIFALSRPENRLSLLGGVKTIVLQMEHNNVYPDIKTLTELLQIVPITDISDVFKLLENHRIKPDIHFFNLLIKKYMLMHRIEDGKAVLQLLSKYNLSPNVMTWGVLAIGCSSWRMAKSLLTEMDSANMVPNKQIMGAFLKNACELFDPRYVLRVMEELLSHGMKPDELFLKTIEHFRITVQQGIINSETGKEIKPDNLKIALKDIEFLNFWQKFKCRFNSYVPKAREDMNVIQDPWAEDYKKRQMDVKRHELP